MVPSAVMASRPGVVVTQTLVECVCKSYGEPHDRLGGGGVGHFEKPAATNMAMVLVNSADPLTCAALKEAVVRRRRAGNLGSSVRPACVTDEGDADPKDEFLVALARAANVVALVSGDPHLTDLVNPACQC